MTRMDSFLSRGKEKKTKTVNDKPEHHHEEPMEKPRFKRIFHAWQQRGKEEEPSGEENAIKGNRTFTTASDSNLLESHNDEQTVENNEQGPAEADKEGIKVGDPVELAKLQIQEEREKLISDYQKKILTLTNTVEDFATRQRKEIDDMCINMHESKSKSTTSRVLSSSSASLVSHQSTISPISLISGRDRIQRMIKMGIVPPPQAENHQKQGSSRNAKKPEYPAEVVVKETKAAPDPIKSHHLLDTALDAASHTSSSSKSTSRLERDRPVKHSSQAYHRKTKGSRKRASNASFHSSSSTKSSSRLERDRRAKHSGKASLRTATVSRNRASDTASYTSSSAELMNLLKEARRDKYLRQAKRNITSDTASSNSSSTQGRKNNLKDAGSISGSSVELFC